MQPVGLKEWEIKFKQNREILPWISRVVELVDWVPASTVYPEYPGKGRCVTWEGGQERLQHFVWFTFTASHVCL